jgi:hypothetical protein
MPPTTSAHEHPAVDGERRAADPTRGIAAKMYFQYSSGESGLIMKNPS